MLDIAVCLGLGVLQIKTTLQSPGCGALVERVSDTGLEKHVPSERPWGVPSHSIVNVHFCVTTDYKRDKGGDVPLNSP